MLIYIQAAYKPQIPHGILYTNTHSQQRHTCAQQNEATRRWSPPITQ